VKFCKVDTDKSQKTAVSLGITAIPTMILFKDGKEIARKVGINSKADLKNTIDEALK